MSIEFEKIIGSAESSNPDDGIVARQKITRNFEKVNEEFSSLEKNIDEKFGKKLDSGGYAKTAADLAADIVNVNSVLQGKADQADLDAKADKTMPVLSLVANPAAVFTEAQINTLRAIKDIQIYGGDLNEKYVVNQLLANDGGLWQMYITLVREGGNITILIPLNHDTTIAWTEYNYPVLNYRIRVLIDWTGLSGKVLNESPHSNMRLSALCILERESDITGGSDKNLQQIDNQFSSVYSLVANPTANFSSAQIKALRAIKQIQISGADVNRKFIVNRLAAAPDWNMFVTEITPEKKITSGISLNHDTTIAWTDFTNATTGLSYRILIDWTGVEGVVLNEPVSENMQLSALCITDSGSASGVDAMMLSEDYTPSGSVAYDSEGYILSYPVAWTNGNTGVYTASDWNESAQAYAGYSVTNAEAKKTLKQPAVTFGSEGNIITYPKKTII